MRELTVDQFERVVGLKKPRNQPAKLRRPDKVIRDVKVYVWYTKFGYVMQVHPPNGEIDYYAVRDKASARNGRKKEEQE